MFSGAKPSPWLVMKFAVRPLAIAVFFVLLALLWTFPFQHVFAYPFIFLFFGAVMCSAWFGGFVSGILAAALSSVLVNFFFFPPLYSLSVAREYRSYETAFIVCAIAITTVSAARRRSEAAIRSARDELEVRVQERTAELQRSNAEIKERERQLRLLTEAIPQQIWRTDGEGSIEYGNRDLLEYLGKEANELAGDAFFEIFHAEDAGVVRASWEQALAAGAKFESKARVRGAQGLFRWYLVRGNPQFDEGRIVRWYGVHIDIDEQQKLLLSQERLTRLARTLSMAEMAASIAHELNQPLTALLADAHACRRWLQMRPPNAQRAEVTAERIVRDTTRASEVVRRVRSLFGRTDYLRERTNLNNLVRELACLLREEAIRREVFLRVQLADDLPLVTIDPVQIQQVLLNLALNGMEAMTHSLPSRVLEISTQMVSGRGVQVVVRDHGVGLTGEMCAKMFEPFFSTKPEGTGIGLAICRSIVEEHEGHIWAEPLDDGAAIYFVLKAAIE
jgi:hypothetical protein